MWFIPFWNKKISPDIFSFPIYSISVLLLIYFLCLLSFSFAFSCFVFCSLFFNCTKKTVNFQLLLTALYLYLQHFLVFSKILLFVFWPSIKNLAKLRIFIFGLFNQSWSISQNFTYQVFIFFEFTRWISKNVSCFIV